MIDLSNSERLRHKINLVLPELMASGSDLMNHPQVDELYPHYLYFLHCMVRAAVPLMEAGLERALARAADDPTAAGVAAYLSHHMAEEERHADWLLEDLEVLGFERAEMLSRAPSATVAALVGAQYYWIFHHHPVALVGHIAVIEGYPPSSDLVANLRARTGFPKAAFRSMAVHAVLEPRHRDDLLAALDRIPLTPEHAALVGMSAIHTTHMVSRALREIVEQYAPRPLSVAMR